MPIDMIIEGGKVVTGGEVRKTDVAIDDGKIIAVGSKKTFPEADKVIDAKGKIVIPGGIDTHSHFQMPFMGETPPETWEEATIATAIGGTTTTIDFAVEGIHPGKDTLEAVKKQLEKAGKESVVDFSTHGVFTDFSDMDKVIKQFKEIVDMGVPGFKEFMIYKAQNMYINDWNLLKVLQNAQKHGAMVGLHAENAEIGESWQKELVD
ncbi:MAG: amidohydrolase family protein, partial [Thermoplasmatota archaeon]